MEITCPYCFERFDSKDVMLRCRGMKCPEEEDKTYMDFWKEKHYDNITPETRHVYKVRRKLFGTNKKCDVCGAEEYDYVCPHCHNELPVEMVNNGAEIISVIGGPQSGKTHYIVALLQELMDNGFEIGLRAYPEMLGKDKTLYTSTKFEEAQRKLNEDLATLDKTAEGAFSLPWIIRVESRDPQIRGKQAPKKSIYLVFYDTAGEHFNTPDEIKANARYLTQSKGVIVLFDTLSIPKIRDILSASGEDTAVSDAATPFIKTWNALEKFIDDRNQHLNEKPFAFVLSKFDVVLSHAENLNFVPQNFIDGKGDPIDRSYVNGKRVFDVNQIKKADDVIRGALKSPKIWNMKKYPEFVEQSWGENARFFGMSAIGAMPKDGSIPEGGIRPYRVMDPLLWIMSKIGGFAFKTINE